MGRNMSYHILCVVILVFMSVSVSIAFAEDTASAELLITKDIHMRDPFIYADEETKTYYMYAAAGNSGYKGVKNMSDSIEHLLVCQGTTSGSVHVWVCSRMPTSYVFNEEVRKKMMQENIWAVEDQLKRLMEAYQRGMWDATDEEIEKLKQIYLELESEIEEMEE